MPRTPSKRLIAVLLALALTAAPGAALAASGGDQYCDPFGGCGVNGGSGGGGTGGKHRPGGNDAPTQTSKDRQYLDAIANSIQDGALAGKARAAAASGPNSAASLQWAKAYRLSKAGEVLDAAGLSAVRLALPNS